MASRLICKLSALVVLNLFAVWACNPIQGTVVAHLTPGAGAPTATPSNTHPTRTGTPVPRPSRPTRAVTLLPTNTPSSSPTPTTRVVPVTPPLSWTGPLIVPAEIPDLSGSIEAGIPIFDLGSEQGFFLPLQENRTGSSVLGWSSDGCSIVVSDYSREHPEQLVNVVTGMNGLQLPGDTGQVLFSPDGKWIAYASIGYAEGYPDPRLGQVAVLHADGNEPILLAEGWTRLDSWTNDGRKVLYWLQKEGRPEQGIQELYAVEVDTMARCLVARVSEPLLRWEDLYLADVTSCEQVSLPLSGELEGADWVTVRYAPGHRHVALFLGRSGGGDFAFAPSSFLMVDTKTGEARWVFEGAFTVSNFWAWSPDGEALALVADFQEDWGVYLVEAATGQRHRLDVGSAYAPSWSPNGRWLAFQSYEIGPFLYRLETEETIHLPLEFGYHRAPVALPLLWSPRTFYGEGACR